MPEEVTYDRQSGLIRVRAWGHDTIEDWLSSKEQVIQYHEKHGAVRLLVDVREQETAPATVDVFEFGADWDRRVRTAILVGEKTGEDQRFLETVAFNRGIQMRVFELEEDALAWLSKSQDKSD